MKSVDFITGLDTTRMPSPAIWGDFPILDFIENRGVGWYDSDDFMSIPKTPPTTEGNWGRFAAFSDTGGTMTNGDTAALLGGSVSIGSDGDNEGASFRSLVTPFRIDRGQGDFAFEGRMRSSTITDTKHNIFLGLMEDAALTAIVPITAAGALADQNLVGFRRTETALRGALIDTVYKANAVTAVTVQSGVATLAVDTYVKLGMRYWPRGHRSGLNYVLAFYVNGVECTTSYQIVAGQGTDFPNDVPMGFVFAVLNATGSTPGTSAIDWYQIAQRASPR